MVQDGGMLTGQTITVDGIQYVLGEDGAVTDTIQEKTEEELQAEAIAAQICRIDYDAGNDKTPRKGICYLQLYSRKYDIYKRRAEAGERRGRRCSVWVPAPFRELF